MRKLRILVVDDEKEQREVITLILKHAGYQVETVPDGDQALLLLEKIEVDIVLTDLVMKGMDGIQLLEEVKRRGYSCSIIIITGYGSIQNAVEAMKKGAYSYFIKSRNPDELLIEIARISKMKELENSKEIADEKRKNKKFLLSTKNVVFAKVLEIAEKAAQSNANVLLLGESGVGKEIIANYIHEMSPRNSRCFLAVNCHAFSGNIIESELFGHERGAFTGAVDRRKGRFEAADGGTLFLDEIGDVPVDTQAKLLRTLETKVIERMGSNKAINVDFRLISATNVNLLQAIEAGSFREDLYYRLCTISITIPPLRERREDIADLAEFFLHKYSMELKKNINTVDRIIWERLNQYDFPGNIRELKNIVERLVVLSVRGVVSSQDLPDNILYGTVPASSSEMKRKKTVQSLKEFRRESEREHIIHTLEMAGFNVAQASRILCISTRHLFNKINEYNIQIRD